MGLFGKKQNTAADTESITANVIDDITGAESLTEFYKDAAECIRYYPDGGFAICRMSIGNMNAINETYGRESGNKVLKAAYQALTYANEGALIARDRSKFVVLIRYNDNNELTSIIDLITAKLKDVGSVIPANPKVYIHTGIFATDGHLVDKSVKEMVACAKIAESEASKRTHNSVVRYTEQLRIAAQEDLELEQDMHTALKKKQFAVLLQPKFDIQTGQVTGAKIMTRWLHPKKGSIAAYRYIPLFVKNGFILDLDLYLFEQMCITLRSWQKKNMASLPLSMNIPRIVVNSRHNMEAYVSLKKKYNVPDNLCELEFSERLVDDKVNTIGEAFEYFKSNGIRCTIENFGAGNASIENFTKFPIDAVKFSRDYFEDGVLDEDEQAQLRAAINAAKAANITTSATGVPESCVGIIKDLGCDVIQGSTDADPLTIDIFTNKYIKKA